MPTRKKNQSEEWEIEAEEDEVEEVLVEYEIATYPSDNTLKVLVDMWHDSDITIPDFQRGYVWTIKQASKLIESFLIGLPVPPIFFYIDSVNKNLVVDGQQRLLSIIFYFEGLFGPENAQGKRQTFRLSGLHPKSKYYNKRFSDLDPSSKRKLESSVLRAVNIRQLSPKEENTSVYHIFERLNTGGTPLTSQEIRNVVFRGAFLTRLKSLNNDSNWREVIGKKVVDKHQKDVELILRIFGLSTDLKSYEKPMNEFLNRTAEKYKNEAKSKAALDKFVIQFEAASKAIAERLPLRPFNVRGPLNTSALDSIFCTVLNNIDNLPKNLGARYTKLVQDKKFEELTSLATTDAKILKDRFAYVKKRLID